MSINFTIKCEPLLITGDTLEELAKKIQTLQAARPDAEIITVFAAVVLTVKS